VDFVVTVFANSKGFASFGYHYFFPMLLAFEIFNFVYMVHSKGNVRFAAQFAFFSG
jgi:hypothetical protein